MKSKINVLQFLTAARLQAVTDVMDSIWIKKKYDVSDTDRRLVGYCWVVDGRPQQVL